MTYAERERARLVAVRDSLFRDPGQGRFAGKERDFVLTERSHNLWAGIRDDAIAYFDQYRISWWDGHGVGPTGHLLSSQVACVNHLYPLRQRADLATALLQALDPEIRAAEPIEDGFVAFEFIGSRQHLKERGFSRGAHCTSVDAAMIGRTEAGERRLFLFEWKYTEAYSRECKYVPARAQVYDELIVDPDGPFRPLDPRSLYFEPFYQLMRQTLLGALLVKAGEAGCASFRHVHVAPDGNAQFHDGVTSPDLAGSSVYEAWRSVLKEPDRFIARAPETLLAPLRGLPDTASHLNYLAARYWSVAAPNDQIQVQEISPDE